MISPCIAGLFAFCDPAAILGTIAKLVVRTIQLQPVFPSGQHISKEVVWLAPSFADLDATPAVTKKLRVVWIVAPRYHIFPCYVKSCSVHPVSGLPVFFETAARRRVSTYERACSNNHLCPARALTPPSMLKMSGAAFSVVAACVSDYGKSSESSVCPVLCKSSARSKYKVSHKSATLISGQSRASCFYRLSGLFL